MPIFGKRKRESECSVKGYVHQYSGPIIKRENGATVAFFYLQEREDASYKRIIFKGSFLPDTMNSLLRECSDGHDSTIGVKLTKYTESDGVLFLNAECGASSCHLLFEKKEPSCNLETIMGEGMRPGCIVYTKPLKVLYIDQPCTVNNRQRGEMTKQDVLVADHSQIMRLVLWEGYASLLDSGNVYRFDSLRVRSYHGEKYLETTRDQTIMYKCTKLKIQTRNIGEREAKEMLNRKYKTVEGNLTKIEKLYRYKHCKKCWRELQLKEANGLGECRSCNQTILLDKAGTGIVATVTVEDEERECQITFFIEKVKQILEINSRFEDISHFSEDDLKEVLLRSIPLRFQLRPNDSVASVEPLGE